MKSKVQKYHLGWNKVSVSDEKDVGYVLILPDGKKQLLPYSTYGSANGQRYFRVLVQKGEASKDSVWVRTKRLDRAKDLVLNRVRKEAMEIVNFVDEIKEKNNEKI